MYAFLYALTGSMVYKARRYSISKWTNSHDCYDRILFSIFFSMMNPASNINLFAAVFPFSSPFCMPLRILVGSAKIGEIVSSAAILIISIILIAKNIYKNIFISNIKYWNKNEF